MRARCRRNAKSRWTVSQSAVQFCWMWRVWVGLLLFATPVWAEENATAYEALRVVGSEFGRDALHQIVSITGTKGNPQPEKWKIVVEDPAGRGVRELELLMERLIRTTRRIAMSQVPLKEQRSM